MCEERPLVNGACSAHAQIHGPHPFTVIAQTLACLEKSMDGGPPFQRSHFLLKNDHYQKLCLKAKCCLQFMLFQKKGQGGVSHQTDKSALIFVFQTVIQSIWFPTEDPVIQIINPVLLSSVLIDLTSDALSSISFLFPAFSSHAFKTIWTVTVETEQRMPWQQ